MINHSILLLLLITAQLTTQAHSQHKLGFSFTPYPDAIRCGNYFYYLMTTSANLSKYNAFTGSRRSIESYEANSDGILSKKVGNYEGNCINQTLEQLWESNRAYRLFNLQRPPNQSVQNNNKFPDVLQCQNGSLLYRSYKSSKSIVYQSPTGATIQYNDATSNIDRRRNIDCGSKTLTAMIADKQTFNIASEKVSSLAAPSISMTGKYPDFLKCHYSDLYVHYISDDQKQIIYQSITTLALMQIHFDNGNYASSKFGFMLDDCINKSIDTLVREGKAWNLNTPVLECPCDIVSTEPVVMFNVRSSGGLKLSYSHQPNSLFPVGEVTEVTVSATHDHFNISLSCSFDINILG